ncbi:hypothetical protein E4T56_gene7255 [Termitomyces sp. T112]|nr:hypothetical protein E4T56_gene7255 [Termitomyces sp. T112]
MSSSAWQGSNLSTASALLKAELWAGGGGSHPRGPISHAGVTLERFAEVVEQVQVPQPLSSAKQRLCVPSVLNAESSVSLRCWCKVPTGTSCIAMEEAWDQDWVMMQLGKGWRAGASGQEPRLEGGGSVRQPAGKVGPAWGGQREGAPGTTQQEQAEGLPIARGRAQQEALE